MARGKHETLAAELEKQIAQGMYGWKGGLPSASELTQTWNLSMQTVKTALSLLEGKKLVEKRGTGYYVNRVSTLMTQYVSPIYVRYPESGYYQNIGPVKRVMLPAYLAEKLEIEPAECVYRVQVSGESIDKPIQISYRYHLMLISDEDTARMDQDPKFDPLWDEAEALPAELLSHDEATPRMATDSEQDLLDLPDGTPVQHLFEAIRDDGKTLMVQEVVLHPRESLTFVFKFTNRPKP